MRVVGGQAKVQKVEGVTALTGTTSTKLDFGRVISGVYTICSLTKYIGRHKRRILNAGHNWLHGHWNGNSGVAHYNAWKTPHHNLVRPNTAWVTMCGQNGGASLKLANGKSVGKHRGGSGEIETALL